MGRSFRKPNLELILSEEEKEKFQQFVATKYKELLDKGLEIKVGDHTDAFVIQPKDGGYQVAFSEKLFETFFNQYMRSLPRACSINNLRFNLHGLYCFYSRLAGNCL